MWLQNAKCMFMMPLSPEILPKQIQIVVPYSCRDKDYLRSHQIKILSIDFTMSIKLSYACIDSFWLN